MLGARQLSGYGKAWTVLWKDKRAFYGKDARPDGRTDGVDKSTKAHKRNDTDPEAVTFWGTEPPVYEDVLLRGSGKVQCKALVDFTCTDGVLAKTCARLGIPYLGFTHTDSHLDALQMHLDQWMFQEFRDENSRFFRADLSKMIDDAIKEDDSGGANSGQPKAKAKGKAKDKPKAKAKKGKAQTLATAAAAAEEEDQEEPDEEDGDPDDESEDSHD